MLRQFCLLLATFIADICHVRLRYLSHSSQISVTFVLDICLLRFRYHSKLAPFVMLCYNSRKIFIPMGNVLRSILQYFNLNFSIYA